MYYLGQLAIVLAFIFSLYTVLASWLSVRRDDDRWLASAGAGVYATLVATSVSTAVLVAAFLGNDYRFQYVAENSERAIPAVYKLVGLWAGLEGSLLFWMFVLACYAACAATFYRRELRALQPYVLGTLGVVAAFFAFLVAFVGTPFAVYEVAPPDGRGMNPLLMNPAMVVHPVALYLGFVGFTVPYAYVVAALFTGRLDRTWLRAVRRWTLAPWLFLSFGLIYGGKWAYEELAWGGMWGWDPVENSALMPWLVATAVIHSIMIQEKRGMLKNWNVGLLMATFLLTILGTFITRSGVLLSVHSFVESDTGPYFLAFLGVATAFSIYIMVDRYDLLREQQPIESVVSKESGFLFNNLLFVGAAFAVFWGTLFPILSEAVVGQRIMVGAPFFNTVVVPIAIALVFLAGAGPLLAWQRSTWRNLQRNFAFPVVTAALSLLVLFYAGVRELGALLAYTAVVFVLAALALELVRAVLVRGEILGEGPLVSLRELFVRHPRRYGGYMVHLGIALMVLGITSYETYQVQELTTVTAGETVTVGAYAVEYRSLGEGVEAGIPMVYADLHVSRNGRHVTQLQPTKRFHPNWVDTMGPTTRVAIHGTLTHDLYVALAEWEGSGERATLLLIVNPLMAWVWIGLYVLVAGAALALWPRRRRRAGALAGREERSEPATAAAGD